MIVETLTMFLSKHFDHVLMNTSRTGNTMPENIVNKLRPGTASRPDIIIRHDKRLVILEVSITGIENDAMEQRRADKIALYRDLMDQLYDMATQHDFFDEVHFVPAIFGNCGRIPSTFCDSICQLFSNEEERKRRRPAIKTLCKKLSCILIKKAESLCGMQGVSELHC